MIKMYLSKDMAMIRRHDMDKHFTKHGMNKLSSNLNQAMSIKMKLQVNQTQHKLLMTRILWLALVKWSVLEPLVSCKLLVKFCNYFKMAKQIRPHSFLLCIVDLNREL